MTQSEVFEAVIDALNGTTVPYMIVGSVASMAYGKPRLTYDMDIVIDMRKEHVDEFVLRFGGDWFVDREMIQKAVNERFHFNIFHLPTGMKVDFFLLKERAYDQEQLARRKKDKFSENKLAFFASVEDVILKKLEYYLEGRSEKHLEDIRGILTTLGAEIDSAYITKWAKENGTLKVWQDLRK